MTLEQGIFILASLLMLGSALAMVTARSMFVAALWMIGTFAGVAVLFILLNAGFLGIVQILIYIGAIAVLILFAIMLTPDVMGLKPGPRYTGQWPLAAVMASTLAAVIVLLLVRAGNDWHIADAAPNVTDFAVQLGEAFMTTYLLPFEVASGVLLVALIGALVIVRDE
nr:NADH-quinone oxidoreductase subunit J [Ardenticatena sp.]